MRSAPKSSLYRFEVTEAAVGAVLEAVEKFAGGAFRPERVGPADPAVRGRWRDPVRPADRRIDWRRDDTATVLRKIHSADGSPGVVDELAGRQVRLHDAWAEARLTGAPGVLLARRDGAVCRATVDGAVWIGWLRGLDPGALKLPAEQVLGDVAASLPDVPLDPADAGAAPTFHEIRYEEHDDVGVLHFDFHNGAMRTAQCRRLLAAWRAAAARQTADGRRQTVAALGANAGAGGAFLALAADLVVARDGVILNPHYKNMGNLYGSELWTYLLPRRVGEARVADVMGRRLPMLARDAREHRRGGRRRAG